MLIELLANVFIIVSATIAGPRCRRAMGRWRHRATLTRVTITGEAYDVRP